MLFYRKRMEAKLAELEGRVDALEDAVKRLTHDSKELDKSVVALWNLYKEKMFAKPTTEQKPKPKRRRVKKNGKEGPVSAE
jgi:hypothetical protein